MKIGLLSDLHLDCHKNYKEVLEEIAWAYKEVDILIVAGDLAEANSIEWEYALEFFAGSFKDVVYCLGNHEAYRTTREYIKNASNDLVSKFPNLHILNNELKTIAGLKFFGGTMWFREVRNDMWLKRGMNDFSQIPDFEKWVYLENADFTQKLQELEPREVDVVVTHHVPSSSCIAVAYLNSPLNRFFICDQVDEIERLQPKVWTAGHCIDEDSEILTTEGWKKHNQMKVGDVSYSYNPITGLLEEDLVSKVWLYQEYTGVTYSLEAKMISYNITEGHNLSFLGANNNKFVQEPISKASSRSVIKYIKSGMFTSKESLPFVGYLLQLYIAIAADGNITPANLVRFHFSKQRKVEYIKGLLKELNIEYKITPSGYIHFRLPKQYEGINIKGLDPFLLNANREDCLNILEAYRNTDGGSNSNGSGVLIYTSKKQEVDLLQHLLTINGFSVSCQERIGHGFSEGSSYTLYALDKTTTTINHKTDSLITQGYVENKLYWCITNTNHNFFMRRKGKIHLTGNCHNKVDFNIDNTRVLINPYGYPHERPRVIPCVFEV